MEILNRKAKYDYFITDTYECGIVFEDFDKMQELDIVEAYIMVEVPR